MAQQQTKPACDRACLEGFVDRYLDAMDADRVDPALFARDVKFTENGNHATNVPARNPVTGQTEVLGCRKQFEVALKGVVSRVRDRRFVAVDRERGVVFAFTFFDHASINWTWQIAELFKVQDGQIRRIEALFHRCPFGLNSGWSTYEQGMSDQPRDIR